MFEFFNEEIAIIPKKLMNQYKDLELSPQAFILLMHLVVNRLELQNEANLQNVAQQMGWKESECYDYLSELLYKNYIRFDMVKDRHGRQRDVINIEPLFEYLYPKEINNGENLKQQLKTMQKTANLVEVFEGEFGRSLTQLELMQLTTWKSEDAFRDELIILALQQAVLNQALSLKYIDRILLEWKKKNIQTIEQAKREINRFNEAKISNEIGKSIQMEHEPFTFPESDWDRL